MFVHVMFPPSLIQQTADQEGYLNTDIANTMVSSIFRLFCSVPSDFIVRIGQVVMETVYAVLGNADNLQIIYILSRSGMTMLRWKC